MHGYLCRISTEMHICMCKEIDAYDYRYIFFTMNGLYISTVINAVCLSIRKVSLSQYHSK